MEIRVCPECDRAFYSPPDSDVVTCAHCGFVAFDRRGGRRVHKELECRFLLEGRVVRARLQDYSSGGLRMVYTGEALDADTVLDVDIKALGIHKMAKTVWSKRVTSSSSSVGLRLL